MSPLVIFQPSGRRGRVGTGITLLEAARELGVDIESVCGGARVCGKCKVRIEEGYFEKFGLDSRAAHLGPPGAEEREYLGEDEIAGNYRLACAAEVLGDVLVFVPEESRGARQVVLEAGRERAFNLNPAVRKYYVAMEPATLADHRGDAERLGDALAARYGLPQDLAVDYFLLCDLPRIVRRGNWQVTAAVWNGREIIQVEPGLVECCPGLAVDVGTTTVAAYLCDLATGRVLAVDSMMNPQVRYGEDVLSRITYAMMNEDGLLKMQEAVIEGINTLAARMAEKAGLTAADIMEVTLVFNTAMQHIALGVEPAYLGRSPFTAASKAARDIKARDLGLRVGRGANVHTLPVEAGFVGPDNVGVLIAEEPYKEPEKIRMVIDIGTNGEIDIGNAQRLLCTSCATGPALEGAQIKFGMRAAPGAIEKVRIDPSTLAVSYQVIGQEGWYPDLAKTGAKGICGSGIIDVVAGLFTSGMIEKSGRFNLKAPTDRLRRDEDGRPEFVLAWAQETAIGKDITFTQGDVRAVQLAKAALYVGARYLMEKLGAAGLDSVTLAGAFGSYIDRESAMIIGMFPDCDPANVVAVGNAAGDGAKLALLDVAKREEAAWIARRVEFLETAVEPDFQRRFAAAMAFPHAADRFPHLQARLDRIPKW